MAHWQMEIVAEMMPTHFAISFWGTPINSTISGWNNVRNRNHKKKIDGKDIQDTAGPMSEQLVTD